jgi:hypothetical protein
MTKDQKKQRYEKSKKKIKNKYKEDKKNKDAALKQKKS